MKLLFIEPFYGGSHENFISGLISHSRHRIELVTLPARFWKWRMRGSALFFVHKIGEFSRYDGIITTDMIDLTDLMALGGPGFPPCMVYFHENQLTYPIAATESIDYQYGITNITTALAARKLAFNSKSHRDAFVGAVSRLMKRMPDARTTWVAEKISEKSHILYPGCHFDTASSVSSVNDHGCHSATPRDENNPSITTVNEHGGHFAISENGNNVSISTVKNAAQTKEGPLIVWNHRWEYDKQPDFFFEALKRIKDEGIRFRLALLGERCRSTQESWAEALCFFDNETVVSEHVAKRSDYIGWLKQADIVVSTAIQENFGISVVEAIRFGALPLLPKRLSYPEIIPESFHKAVFYSSFDDLVAKLKYRLLNMDRFGALRQALSTAMAKFSWRRRIKRFDAVFDDLFTP